MINKIFAFAVKEITAKQAKEVGEIYCLPETKISDKIKCPKINRGHWDYTDNVLSEVLSEKLGVKKVRILSDNKIAFIVSDGEFSAHGDTIKEAKADLELKKIKVDLTPFKSWDINTKRPVAEIICAYMSITRACFRGTKAFLADKKFPKKMSIASAIEITA